MKTFLRLALLFACSLAFSQTPNGINPNGLPAVSISVVASPPTVAVGATSTLSAQYVLQDSSANIFMTAACQWSSSNTAVATVSSTGIVTGVSGGSALITCIPTGVNSLNLGGSTTVTVGSPPVINNPTCTTPPCALPAGANLVPYGPFLFMASGGVPPYTWTVSAGTLNTGLSLGNVGCGSNIGCALSGTPTVNGTQTFTIQVQDTALNTTTLQVGLTVSASAGSPQQYGARSDICELGTEPQCSTPGPLSGSQTSGTAGTGAPLHSLGRFASLGFCTSGTGCTAPYLVSQLDTVPSAGPVGAVNCDAIVTTQPSNGQYPCAGSGSVPYALNFPSMIDGDFGSDVYRVTDWSLSNTSSYPCNGAGNAYGTGFNLGSTGTQYRWSSDASKLVIQNTSGVYSILSWNPATHTMTPSAICKLNAGNYTFSPNNPHQMYASVNDQESSVLGAYTSGAFITQPGESIKQDTSSATATVLSVVNGLMQIGSISGTPNASSPWRSQGGGSGVFTPTAAPTPAAYVNLVMLGTINDGGAPSTWTVTWAPIFNFNYVAGLGAPFFPTTPTSCMPGGFQATYNGTLTPSADTTSIGMVLSDNGQSNKLGGSCSLSPGGVCTGPANVVSWTSGSGCRVWNTMTDIVTGDWGPTGQMLNGMVNKVTGTVAGTFNPGDVVLQGTSNATATLNCTINVSGACSTTAMTGFLLGPITGTADATHTWTDQTTSATLTSPSAPVHPAFFYPNLMHEGGSTFKNSITKATLLQPASAKLISIQGNTPSTGLTTLTFSGGTPINTGSLLGFYNITNAFNSFYLNCTSAPYTCPTWTISVGTTKSGSNSTIVIVDAVNPHGSYTDTFPAGCTKNCPQATIAGSGMNGGQTYPSNPNYWQTATLNVFPCLDPSCQGHEAVGFINDYRAKIYTAHQVGEPDLPCAITPTPCPNVNQYSLFNQGIPVDQHGSYQTAAGNGDQSPVFLATTQVAGQAPGQVGNITPPTYGSAYWDEIDSGENFVQNPFNAHCIYTKSGSPTTSSKCSPSGIANGCASCTYRHAKTNNTGGNWNFNAQNAIGTESPDGKWFAFASDWGNSLGCMDGTSKCWSNYIGSGVPSQAIASVSGTSGSSSVTVNLSTGVTQNFCALGTYVGASGAIQYCGGGNNLAEQIILPTMTGSSDTWLNSPSGSQTILSITGTTSTSFTGTVASCAKSIGYNPSSSLIGTCTVLTSPSTYSNTAESGNAISIGCAGGIQPCQRSDIFVIDLLSGTQNTDANADDNATQAGGSGSVPPGWAFCTGACAGAGSVTNFTQTYGDTSQALDASGSLKVGWISPANTNWLGTHKAAGASSRSDTAENTAIAALTHFTSTVSFYPDTNAGTYVSEYEFDSGFFSPASIGSFTPNGTNYMFGMQCNLSSHLMQVWNGGTGGGWVTLTYSGGNVPCASIAANTWHTWSVTGHLVTGDQTACTSGGNPFPLDSYDSVTLDGVTYIPTNTNTCAQPLNSSFASLAFTQVQADSTAGSSGNTVTIRYDKLSFRYF